MAIVCQKCGASGYADLLIYCRLCRKAAEHQYCLDIIPKVDENIEWSCEDCDFKANKLKCIVNNQRLELSNDDLCLSNKENVISNQNLANDLNVSRVSHNSKSRANLHARKYYEMKSWGKTNKRSTKHILNDLNDHLIDDATTLQLVECIKSKPRTKSKPKLKPKPKRSRKLIVENEDDDLINDIAKDFLFESEDHVAKDWEKTYEKSMKHDHLRNGVTTSQLVDCSKPIGHKRKLVLLDEDNDLVDDLSFDNEIVLKEMFFQHRSYETREKCGGVREVPLINEEDNKVEGSLLKETIVDFKNNTSKESDNKTIVRKTDDEMASKGVSRDESKKPSDVLTKVHLHNSTKSPIEFNDMLAMPISWRGWFKVCGTNCGPLIARLSPKAGEKAWNATGSLPQVIQLTMVSRSHAWPRSFEVSPPTDNSIALAFFPPDSRVEKMVEQLVQEVIRCDLAMKVILDEAELLIFPSNLLPENYKRYQDKYYLWGVFKRKDSDKNTAEFRMPVSNENNCTKQPDHNLLIKSDQVQKKRGNEKISLEKDEPHETLCPLTNVAVDRKMGTELEADEELNGCLELFPTHVENIALKLNAGDGNKTVDLTLGLGLPFRQ